MAITPEDLRVLCDLFAEEHPEYADPAHADGMCGAATDEFWELVNRVAPEVKVREVHFTSRRIWAAERRVAAVAWEAEIPTFPYSRGPAVYHGGLTDHMGHIVAEVDGVCVDFTARQFRPDAPFPLIFQLPT